MPETQTIETVQLWHPQWGRVITVNNTDEAAWRERGCTDVPADPTALPPAAPQEPATGGDIDPNAPTEPTVSEQAAPSTTTEEPEKPAKAKGTK